MDRGPTETSSRRAADAMAGLFHALARHQPRAVAQKFVLQHALRLFTPGSTSRLLATPPLDLTADQQALLQRAAAEDWSRVQPAIFGALFEASMDQAERHALGAHFTEASDILKIVGPTIEAPWSRRIDGATTLQQLTALHAELQAFRVLDPACGSGNFLIVAYHALRRLERRLLDRLHRDFAATGAPGVHPRQLHGLDIDGFAVALARLTLALEHGRVDAPIDPDELAATIVEADALLADWPAVDAIVGNPPFLDARKFTPARADALRGRFPDVPGRADLCVYWFRRAHDQLAPGQRAGLVGTNTIRQNYSREGGLDVILASGGTITDAVASQVWSGDAAVHVSIVNWIRGAHDGPCTLATQLGDAAHSPWRTETVPRISAALRAGVDVSTARPLRACAAPFCFEGIQPGHRAFRLTAAEYTDLLRQDPTILASPYMNGDDLLSATYLHHPEYLVDLEHPPRGPLLARLRDHVLPAWQQNAAAERFTTGKPTGEHQNRLANWWRLKRPRRELQHKLSALPRYIVCARVTRRPIFAFLDSTIKPDSSLTVFAAADDYTFGVLQSGMHWSWFQARCSTLKRDARYTSNTVFDSFVWPQAPGHARVAAVARAAVHLRAVRDEHPGSLRALHRALEADPRHPLHAAQHALDAAVRAAHGMADDDDPLAFLLALNADVADRERRGEPVTGPGLPTSLADAAPPTRDCISVAPGTPAPGPPRRAAGSPAPRRPRPASPACTD